MKLKQIPLVAVLFLMGCSYGCDSKNKANTDFEEERPVEEPGSDFAPLEEENLNDVVEEISEEEPVVEPDPTDVPAEDFVDGAEEPVDAGENFEEEADDDVKYQRQDEAADSQPQEDYGTQEEEYVDDGQIYEEDYPEEY